MLTIIRPLKIGDKVYDLIGRQAAIITAVYHNDDTDLTEGFYSYAIADKTYYSEIGTDSGGRCDFELTAP